MVRKNDGNYLARVEKWLKSSMKKKITITSGTIVAFMITGAFFYDAGSSKCKICNYWSEWRF